MFSAFNPSKSTHTWSSGQPTLRRPGSSLGVRCIAQGSHLSRGQFLPEPRFKPTTSGYKSNALSIRPWLPHSLGHESAQFLFSVRKHISLSLSLSLSLSASAQFLFSVRKHISLSLSLHLLSFCSPRGRKEQSLIQLNTDIVACFSNFTCKYSQNHSTVIVIILWVFYLIRQRLDYKDFCAD